MWRNFAVEARIVTVYISRRLNPVDHGRKMTVTHHGHSWPYVRYHLTADAAVVVDVRVPVVKSSIVGMFVTE